MKYGKNRQTVAKSAIENHQQKPKEIRDESVKKFIAILGEFAEKYTKSSNPKAGVFGKAIQSIKQLGTTEFKKRMTKGEKVPYVGDYITKLYNEFVTTGKCKDLKKLDGWINESQEKIKKIDKQLQKAEKEKEDLYEKRRKNRKSLEDNQDRPIIHKRDLKEREQIREEISKIKERITSLTNEKKKCYSELNNELVLNTLNFGETMSYLTKRLNMINL